MPESITLDGCAPAPLASYLKALGVLRVISSDTNHVHGRAADPTARGWWEGERFHIRTMLDQTTLCGFFLDEYAPSPIIAPWNGRAGFLEGDAGADSSRAGAELMSAIQRSRSPRLSNMRRTVESLRSNEAVAGYDGLRAKEKRLTRKARDLKGDEKVRAEDELKAVKRQASESKGVLLPTLRATTDPEHLAYIDACYVLSTDEAPAPLLGSGGNDGSRDFGVNFAEHLLNLFDFDNGDPIEDARIQIEGALFDLGQRLGASGSMGQFSPGQGGANATTGYEGYGALNRWDVVLALEGTMVFAGALTRRWGATGDSRAAFPFTFDPVGAGAGSLSAADPNRPRGEIWTPLWRKPATYSEVSAIFGEGRLTLERRAARTGLDAARSVTRMGQARGIGSFERYSFIQPDSKMPYQATPLGRFNAPRSPRRDLIADLEVGGWLEIARRHAGSNTSPAHAKSAMRRLQDALFQMTAARQKKEGTCNALIALGGFVRWMTTNPRVREVLRPPPVVPHGWVDEADDGSPEFRVAVALAGLGVAGQGADGTKSSAGRKADDATGVQQSPRAPPMASHFAPIDENRYARGRRSVWSASTNTPNIVWGTGNLVSNMIAVLERRLVDATIRGLPDKPFAGASHARLADVAVFLSGDFDDSRCAALLAGLIWTRPAHPRMNTAALVAPVPFAYAALKPIFTPDEALRRLRVLAEAARLPVPSELIPQLRAGGNRSDGRASDAAVRTALARARGSGIPSPFDPARSGGRPGIAECSRYGTGVPADRLAASLLIPIGDPALKILVNRAYPGAIAEPNTESMEDTTDAA
ncbi:MAG: type I-U CRISPR-associated protein Csx17 [Chromatiales bacterium]|nr:type I-U CRISPR-associated protein Csx17 [Chromatiales bacterium]